MEYHLFFLTKFNELANEFGGCLMEEARNNGSVLQEKANLST